MGLKPTDKASLQNFPYRFRSPKAQIALNQKISPLISRVNDMLYKLVRRRVKGLLDEDHIDEVVQKCRIWLWQKSLPKYDSTRGVKVSTFMYRCATNFINQEVRAIMRRSISHRRVSLMDPEMMRTTVRENESAHLDNRIAAVANDVVKSPEKYLSNAQVKVFTALMENPKAMMKDLAVQLGYKRASSLSMMLRRIRERIAEISIEDFPMPEKWQITAIP